MDNANLYQGYDQQGLDGQYNNRARVPEHVEIHTGWETEGEAVLAEVDTRREVAYGPRPEETRCTPNRGHRAQVSIIHL